MTGRLCFEKEKKYLLMSVTNNAKAIFITGQEDLFHGKWPVKAQASLHICAF